MSKYLQPSDHIRLGNLPVAGLFELSTATRDEIHKRVGKFVRDAGYAYKGLVINSVRLDVPHRDMMMVEMDIKIDGEERTWTVPLKTFDNLTQGA